MPMHPSLASKRALEPADRDPESLDDAWDGLCPSCGTEAELTSYLGTDEMRSEEYWWCPHCALALNVRVVRLVERARSGKTGEIVTP